MYRTERGRYAALRIISAWLVSGRHSELEQKAEVHCRHALPLVDKKPLCTQWMDGGAAVGLFVIPSLLGGGIRCKYVGGNASGVKVWRSCVR